MRRVVTVVVATVGGLALLASFHTTPGVATRPAARGQTALKPPAGGAPPTSGTTPPVPGPTTNGTAGPTTAPPTTAPAARRTIVGPVVTNRYGDVQVEIVVQGGHLVDVESVQLPMERETSAQINNIAGPDLRDEALQAGNAQIDVITGATYTSYSYAQSLQAALDQAGIH